MWWAWVVAAMAVSEAHATRPASTGSTPVAAPARRVVEPQSWAQERAIYSQAPTLVWSSRVGKGKSYGGCLNIYAACAAVPGVPAALTRLERSTMDTTTLLALRKLLGEQAWSIGWKPSESTFYFPKVRCPDGQVRQSRIYVFGWSDPGRQLGAEFARVVVDQAEQIERSHYSIMQTRLRFMDPWVEEQLVRYGLARRQLVLICNPDDPDHWINRDFEVEDKGAREEINTKTGTLAYEVILSQPEDNTHNLPPEYESERLAGLEGTVWYDRLVGGRWVRAEGLVYGKVYQPAVHIVDRPGATTENPWGQWAKWRGYPPPDWPRYRAFDFGVNHPFTVAWYAEDRLSGLIYTYREGYSTGRTGSEWGDWIVEQEALELEALRAGATPAEAKGLADYLDAFRVHESWSDHDLEWRKELQAKGVWTKPAQKDLKAGVQKMTQWLKARRIVYLRDMLVEEDPVLRTKKEPVSVLGEFSRYKWPKPRPESSEFSSERMDVPVDRWNHGLDRDRYFIASHEGVRVAWAA